MEGERERIARLEERVKIHEENWEQNTKDHKSLMFTVNRIDRNMFAYQKVVFTVSAVIGGIAGLIIHEWDWLINKMGH